MQVGTDFDEFFRAEHHRLVALAIGLTGVPEAARDLVQDTMTKAYRDWARVSQLDRPGAWARRVTVNAAIDWQRRRRREDVALRRLDRRDGHEAPGVPESESARFWAAVRALPDKQRAVIALYYLEDRSVGDVAATIEMAPGTVKSTLHAARAALAAALGVTADQGDDEQRTDGRENGRTEW
jgi:RNA polymerase sigma-70 factor (ECF subfamily)